jgi:DNA-binding protein HU-beta
VNKSELIDKVAGEAGIAKSDAEKAVNAFITVVQTAVAADDKVTLPGFGAWSRSQRSARTGRNPRTGEPVAIPASKAVKFSVGADFKKKVNI